MKALKLIESATYDPAQLRILRQAFDAAWEEIKPAIRPGPDAAEAARLKLASAVLTVARTVPIEVERLKTDALTLMFANPTQL